jgi:hypothetical protein
MRDVAKWIRGMPVNGHAANHRLPGDDVLGTELADVIAAQPRTEAQTADQR